MKPQDKYSIDIQALTPGVHSFEFEVKDDLFTMWEESEIKKGELKVDIELRKLSSMLELDIRIVGQVEVTCDRCLEEFMQPVDYFGKLVVKITDQQGEDDGDIMWLHPSDSRLSLAQYIYESAVLSLPFQRVHPSLSECNQDMLSRFTVEPDDQTDDQDEEEEYSETE